MTNANLPIAMVYPEVIAFGGEERVLIALARYLFQSGLSFEIVMHHDRIGLQKHADIPLNIRELKPRGGVFSKAWALRGYLRPLIAAGAPRPLVIGLQGAVHAGLGGLSGYGIRAADPPSLVGQDPDSRASAASMIKGRLYARMARGGFRRADLCITNARYLAAEFEDVYGAPFKVVYPGGKAPPAGVPRRSARTGGDFRILSVSRLEWNKRVDWIVDAAVKLQERSADAIHVDIVGEGRDRDQLEVHARAAGLKNIRFHGFVSDDVLETLYAAADVFVMPAIQGFGLPALEALYRRLPVVLHRDSGAVEILSACAWAECFSGGAEELAGVLAAMRARIANGTLNPEDLAALPTEASMAKGIADLMGWRGAGMQPR